MKHPRHHHHHQQGLTMLVVLVLLSVMLLGGLALARMTEVGTLAAGNSAFRESALQASEVGINTAFTAVQTEVTNENANIDGWYFASRQVDDATRGIPDVNYDGGRELTVGPYTLHYVIDRVCEIAGVTDPLRQCLVKQQPMLESASGGEKPDPPSARQFRITVRVTGPKDTRVWVQSLMTKGVAP